MSLDVITLTRGNRLDWLEECSSSIDFGHQVLRLCPGDFQAARWQTTSRALSTYVAWLDDDDRAMPGALERCVDALEATGAAMAFTNEARINAQGERIGQPYDKPRTRRDLAMHPRSAHHLTVFRVSMIDPIVRIHAERIGIGIDWLFRAYAGLVLKAVHVPIVGCEWRQHDGQDTKNADFANAYEKAMPELRAVTRGWMGPFDAPISQHGA